MKANSTIKIVGSKVILVPYKKKHVEKYNKWMKSEELLDLTASEPLTLHEEYEMQHFWFQDDNKCTFIVLDKEMMSKTNDEIGSMIGDVNLYLNDRDDPKAAEIEIMIADPIHRAKGNGYEALLHMMRYATEILLLHKFIAKIKLKNEPSIKLFTKVGFKEDSRSDVFKEVLMICEVNDVNNFSLFQKQIYEIKDY